MFTRKTVITWKDADQNLCTLAAYIFDECVKDLRNSADMNRNDYPSEDGRIPAGWAESDEGLGSRRTIFSTAPPGIQYRVLPVLYWLNDMPASPDFDDAREQFGQLLDGDYGLLNWVQEETTEWFNWIEAGPWDSVGMSPQCWYCFQNIVKQNLEKYRNELRENLYRSKRKRGERRTKNKSRNAGKRGGSKHGRQAERG